MPTGLTLRVSQIPAVISANQFIDIFEAFLNRDLPENTKEVRKRIVLSSFAPSAISSDREKLCVATVTFQDISLVLLGQSKEIALTGAGRLFVVVVDLHFYGLTPLNNPASSPAVDIIAVTGLAGHAFGSWKSRGEPEMWLRDFLPEHVPTARILTYGYDSKLQSESTSSISDYSRRFIETLKAARAHENEKHRPIIFIGHSLGGLVIKQAIVVAARGSEKDKQVFLSCYGLLFFGVPNRGLRVNELRSMVKGHPNETLIEELDPASLTLRLLHKSFCSYFDFQDSPIVSFFETRFTKAFVETQKGIWRRDGPAVLMVPANSATYSGLTEKLYDQIPIHADHSEMTKFTCSSGDFLICRQRIIEFVEKAPEVIRKRFVGASQWLQTDDIPRLWESMKTLLCPVNFEPDTTHRAYDHCEGTGEWLLSNAHFTRWRDMLSHDILWLRGSPGCGKTYLMSRVLEHIKGHHRNATIVYFFCDNKTDNPERKSISSIVKTLVFQLLAEVLPYHPDDVEICLRDFKRFGDERKMIQWLLKSTLERVGKHLSRAFLVLDALDECEEAHDLLVLLGDIGAFQTILTSRESIQPYKPGINKRPIQTIQLSPDQVAHDVNRFIRSKVQLLDIRNLRDECKVADTLIEGCDSLFLLARFRIESLERSKLLTQRDLDKALSSLPNDLTRFYDKAVEDMKGLDYSQCALIRKTFMWVLYAKRQLNLKELIEAITIPSENERFSRQVITQQSLGGLCGGLLVFKSHGNSTVVDLAHSTVKEYIYDFVWGTLPPMPSLRDDNSCISDITQASITYMYSLKDKPLGEDTPFLHYVYNYWILHLLDLKNPTQRLRKEISRFLDSKACFEWWDSPETAALDGKVHDRSYLQSQFRDWVMTNTLTGSKLRRHIHFMIHHQKKQVTNCERNHGKDHPITIAAMNNLATAFEGQGQWKESESLHEKIVATRIKALGTDHIDTLTAMNNLATAFEGQGQWKESESLHEKIVATRIKVLGTDHIDTLAAMSSLAMVQSKMRPWEMRNSLQRRSVATSKMTTGAKHSSPLPKADKLANKDSLSPTTNGKPGKPSIYRNTSLAYSPYMKIESPQRLLVAAQGSIEYENSSSTSTRTGDGTIANYKPSLWEILKLSAVTVGSIYSRMVDADDQKPLPMIDYLAGTYKPYCQLQTLETIEKKVIAARKRILGEDHPDTLMAISNLAGIYSSYGQLEMAERLERHVMTARRRVLGKAHPDTLTVISSLSSIYREQGQLETAKKMDLEVIKTRTKVLGDDHPDTLIAISNLASTYKKKGKWGKAEKLERQVMDSRMRALGKSHPETLATMHSLALISSKQGRVRDAIDLLEEIADTSRSCLGDYHPETIKATVKLAEICTTNGYFIQATYSTMAALQCIKKNYSCTTPLMFVDSLKLSRPELVGVIISISVVILKLSMAPIVLYILGYKINRGIQDIMGYSRYKNKGMYPFYLKMLGYETPREMYHELVLGFIKIVFK